MYILDYNSIEIMIYALIKVIKTYEYILFNEFISFNLSTSNFNY